MQLDEEQTKAESEETSNRKDFRSGAVKWIAGVIACITFVYFYWGLPWIPSEPKTQVTTTHQQRQATQQPVVYPIGTNDSCRGPATEPLRTSKGKRAKIPHPSCQSRVDPVNGCVAIYGVDGANVGRICPGGYALIRAAFYEIEAESDNITVAVRLNECSTQAIGKNMDECT